MNGSACALSNVRFHGPSSERRWCKGCQEEDGGGDLHVELSEDGVFSMNWVREVVIGMVVLGGRLVCGWLASAGAFIMGCREQHFICRLISPVLLAITLPPQPCEVSGQHNGCRGYMTLFRGIQSAYALVGFTIQSLGPDGCLGV